MTRFSSCLLVGLALAITACGSSRKSSGPVPGADCARNSDCDNPLACDFGRCHVQCSEARDCEPQERCVIGPADNNLCLLPDETSCALNSMCPEGLFCAQDLQCRSQCDEDRDCPTPTQKCVPSEPNAKVCAEPEELVGDALLIVMRSDTDAGDDDAATNESGMSGAGGAGGSSGEGGSSGSSGEGGMGGSDASLPNDGGDGDG